jgi:hypothetical protein
MRSTYRSLLPAAAVAGGCLLVSAASSIENAHGAPARTPCNAGQVVVELNGRSSCQPAAAVLPRPKAGDRRLADLRSALSSSSSPFGHFGAAGKQARGRFLGALPKVLALIDARKRKTSGLRRLAAVSRSASVSGCKPAEPVAGSTSVQALTVSLAGNGATMVGKSGGQTFVMRFTTCGDSGFYVPPCPSASGDAYTSGRDGGDLTQEVWDGDVGSSKLLSRVSASFTSSTKAHGKVADDARLDYVDIDSTQEALTVATGGVVLRGSDVRRVRVDMRTGAYDAASSSVTIRGDASQASTTFPLTVAAVTQAFREAEVGGSFLHTDGWSTFERKGKGGYCATALFTPKGNTVTLQPGQRGQLGISAKGRDGGKAAGARWTLLDPVSASFSPSAARGPSPSVSYQVTSSPSGKQVAVTAKFTSTAGVGENTWTQKLGGADRWVGAFSGSHTFDFGGGLHQLSVSWSGSAAFALQPGTPADDSPSYLLERGSFTFTATERVVVTVDNTCTATISGNRSLPPGSSSGHLVFTGRGKLTGYHSQIEGLRGDDPAIRNPGWECTKEPIDGPAYADFVGLDTGSDPKTGDYYRAMEADARTIAGEIRQDVSAGGDKQIYTFKWSFTRKP